MTLNCAELFFEYSHPPQYILIDSGYARTEVLLGRRSDPKPTHAWSVSAIPVVSSESGSIFRNDIFLTK